MHSFHLTCLFKRDRWKRCSTYAGTVSGAVLPHETARKRWTRCSTYAGTVSGAVTSATKYSKSSEEDPGAARSNVAMATLLFMPRGGFSNVVVHVILHVHLLLMVVVEEL